MSDDFKEYPKSVTEIKSDKSNKASDWKPRDALIDMLRMIDSGEITPSVLIVCYRDKDGNEMTKPGFRVASPDPLETLGVLAYCSQRIAKLGDE
jgi:hypothetical protein